MKKLPLLFILLNFSAFVFSQAISESKTFKVSGYSLNAVGYPSKLVPLGNEKFAYVEYWTQDQGRKYPAYYLQGYNGKGEEEWFTPLNKQNEPQYKVIDLIRLKKNIAVAGRLYSPTTKREETYVKFFSLEGKEIGGQQKLSTYDKSAKGAYEDFIDISADSTKVLWMGQNPAASGKKKLYYFSVYESDGKLMWGKKLAVPYTEGKYKVQQSAVDGKGNLYLLLINEAPLNTAKDTLLKPWILRYDFRENKFAEHKVDFPNATVPEGRIHITRQGELIFSGILSDGSANGFLNGGKAFPTAMKWNKISLKKFNISRELTLTTEYTIELPEAWIKRYGANGSNFSKSIMLDQGKQIYWVLEENWTQIHNKELQHLYYDIAVVAFDIETGKIDWANFFEKKQRDYRSGNLLSYVAGIASGKLNFVYLNERGAQGKILCSSFDLKSGVIAHKELVSNFNSDFLFFPKRSGMVTPQSMILMGVGRPNENEYKLIRILF